MSSLDMDLGKIQEAADLDFESITEEGKEAARVKSAKALTESSRKSGDNAGSLLSDLFSDSDAEAEVASRIAKKKAAEEKKREEENERAEQAKREAEKRLEEEKKRIAEMEERKAKMEAEMERQRRIEELGYDEEEVARQKAEEEARQKAEEEEEAREIEENERLLAELRANQAELDAKARAKAEKLAEEERIARQKRLINTIIGVVASLILISGLTFYFVTKKAPDFYVLQSNYTSVDIKLEPIPSAGMTQNAIAKNLVIQEAPKVIKTGGSRGPKQPTDKYGIGSVTNVLSTSGGLTK